MWDPSLPVIGFATPNPLPHQLRGGALGAMQLKLAREEKKRRIQQRMLREEKERQIILNETDVPSLGKTLEKDDEEDEDHTRMDVDGEDITAVVRKRKREYDAMNNHHDGPNNERVEQKLSESNTIIKNPLPPSQQQQLLSRGRPAELTKEKANMNLSDSSSSDDDDDD
jgi:hypothetical protein